jgi:hypothetical protein
VVVVLVDDAALLALSRAIDAIEPAGPGSRGPRGAVLCPGRAVEERAE